MEVNEIDIEAFQEAAKPIWEEIAPIAGEEFTKQGGRGGELTARGPVSEDRPAPERAASAAEPDLGRADRRGVAPAGARGPGSRPAARSSG